MQDESVCKQQDFSRILPTLPFATNIVALLRH